MVTRYLYSQVQYKPHLELVEIFATTIAVFAYQGVARVQLPVDELTALGHRSKVDPSCTVDVDSSRQQIHIES